MTLVYVENIMERSTLFIDRFFTLRSITISRLLPYSRLPTIIQVPILQSAQRLDKRWALLT